MADTQLIETLDEFQAEYRKGIGTVLRHRPSKQANLDNIRRYGDGVGDYNPLYRDVEYAQQSRFGQITAPPTFLYSVTLGVIAGETGAIDRRRVSTRYLPVNYAGAEIEFIRPIWRDDNITAVETVGETQRKTSKRIGPINFNTGHVVFTNNRKETVATINTLMARYQNTGGILEYDRTPKSQSGDARQSIVEPADPLVWERTRRGNNTLYWEDVIEGENIPSLKKGTYSVTELFLFTHGVLGTGRSTRGALESEGSADLGGGGRFDEEHAQKRRNMPGQFDFGPQRVCWLAQIVTDWMGDDGILKKLSASIRHPNIVGDTNTLHGSVVRKFHSEGQSLVEVSIENVNQSGLPTAFGTAIVELPTRD
ncbi:MAG: MaoC family dehydratase N-terminal domain-containing protein [Gammaproteobacteria bacterium]|nr:MaoC family dehydratase N-terminal domain-containing protein [Gammaproteobacteria bacterium]